MQGTPVKSCMITRAGVNWISVSGSASGVPARERADVVGGDVRAVLGAQQVLQQHLEAEREVGRRPGPHRRRRQPVDLVGRRHRPPGCPRAPKLSNSTRCSRLSPSRRHLGCILPQAGHGRPRRHEFILTSRYLTGGCRQPGAPVSPPAPGRPRTPRGGSSGTVERAQGGQPVAGPAAGRDVAGQRRRVAGDVDDHAAAPGAAMCPTTSRPGTGARRVEHHDVCTSRRPRRASQGSTGRRRPGANSTCGRSWSERRASAAARRSDSTATTVPSGADRAGEHGGEQARRRRRGRGPRSPGRGAAAARTASSSAAAAPGCTCQNPGR